MKLETRQRLAPGNWSVEEAVTSVTWVVSPTIEKKQVTDVKVYLLNDQKRMVTITFSDLEEVRALRDKLTELLAI